MEREELLAIIEEAKQRGQTRLDLSSKQITELPEEIGQLTNLTYLDLKSNQLTTLPESIAQLTNLTFLDLYNIRLTTLPESITQLTNLAELNLSSNYLITLPESIGQLTNLRVLKLGFNELTTLPKSIIKLTNLTRLYLRRNNLTAFPDVIIQLTNLTFLNLDENPLTELPPELRNKDGLKIRDYYRQRLEEQTDYIYEAKLLIIGEGGAGKTSLVNKLINSNYTLKLEGSEAPEKSTEGIDVVPLTFSHLSGNPFRVNAWDFGGQEIYHATHQFFLTKRSLYLLVADTRQENTNFNYWLEVVELLSESSPVLIIKNEKQERLCQVNESQLRGRFRNLRDTSLATNLATNRGLQEIRDAIKHHISQLPHIGQALPKTWVNVRKALESETRNFIPQTEFLALCDTHGFKRHEDKLQLSEYLHDLGVCLHFQDDTILKNWVILKPEWGTAAVYTVLDTEKVQKNFGTFTQADLAIIWADEQYTNMRDELLQLMMRFKLCYEIAHRPKNYIAPQLLSPNQPQVDWDESDNLILRYHYEFMPKGMITRFIVEMHRLIDNGLIWKDGVILHDDHARAEVIEARYRNEIRIRISGQIKKPLLENIRYEFRKIHESYNKPDEPPETHRLRYQEYIPCNCSVCKGSQSPHAYALQRLNERLRNDRYEIECDISYQMVSVRSLMDDAIGRLPQVQTNENSAKIYHYGDIVYGDKVGQDKVEGDKTEQS
jgi:internalin A